MRWPPDSRCKWGFRRQQRDRDRDRVSEGKTMPELDIAQVKIEGVDLIIVKLERTHARQSFELKKKARLDLQQRAKAAGLTGTVVTVWDAGGGNMGFLSPPEHSEIFGRVNLNYVSENINAKLAA
jgi:hypothetical protein